MSNGIGITTIIGCLAAGEPLMQVLPSGWWGTGDAPEDQKFFIARQLGWRKGLEKFGNTLRSFAHFDPRVVSAKAKEWDMRIQVPDDFTDGGVGMISQYKQKLDWLYAGEKVNYLFPYPAFWLKMGVGFFAHQQSAEPVIRIAIDSNTSDVVYVTRWNEPLSGFGILRQIESIEESMRPSFSEYDGVQIPCVLADMDVDLSWIIGMKNAEWFVSWAQQKILFGMDYKGFAVREETAMRAMKGIVGPKPKPYVVSPNNESFLFWRRRPNVSFPLSIYQFTKEDFKDPGDLNAIIA